MQNQGSFPFSLSKHFSKPQLLLAPPVRDVPPQLREHAEERRHQVRDAQVQNEEVHPRQLLPPRVLPPRPEREQHRRVSDHRHDEYQRQRRHFDPREVFVPRRGDRGGVRGVLGLGEAAIRGKVG